MTSKEKLSSALLRVRELDEDHWIVKNARAGVYDDFESEHPAPKMLLDAHLNQLASETTVASARQLLSLVKMNRAGEFDGTSEEAEKWMVELEKRDPKLASLVKKG